MIKYEIIVSKVAAKELKSNPRPVGYKKLVGGKEDSWRVRVGNYRIVYTINDTVFFVDIHRVGYRGDIYK